MNLFSTFILASALGTLSAYLAYRRQRNPYAWFFIGFLFGLLGIAAIFFVPQKKAQAAAPQAAPQPPPLPQISGPADKFWYYLDTAHEQQGPMSFDALIRSLGQGKISLATLVWHEDLPTWKPLQELVKESC